MILILIEMTRRCSLSGWDIDFKFRIGKGVSEKGTKPHNFYVMEGWEGGKDHQQTLSEESTGSSLSQQKAFNRQGTGRYPSRSDTLHKTREKQTAQLKLCVHSGGIVSIQWEREQTETAHNT